MSQQRTFQLLLDQQEPQYSRLVRWLWNIQEYTKKSEIMSGKKVVMAVGATGCGKSTLMNAIIQGVDNIDMDDECNIVAKGELKNGDEVVFKIGHEVSSCTQAPGFYLHNDIYYIDCPGLEDQDKFKEYPNQTQVHIIQKNAKASLIMCVIGVDQFANRGAIFVTQLTGILRQLSPKCSKEDMKQILVPILVRYQGSFPAKIKKHIETVIDAIKSKYILQDPEYLNIFLGSRFPQLNEVDQFISLCEVVMENYVAVDAMDNNDSNFSDREVMVNDMQGLINGKFTNNQVGKPENFNDDLPLQLQDLLLRDILANLLYAKKFQNDQQIRDEASLLFTDIFESWTGELTTAALDGVKDIIEISDQSGRNAFFQWYVNAVSPILKNQAKNEGNNAKENFNPDKTDEFPIICLLRFIAIEHDIINELDKEKFTLEVFKSGLTWFKKHFGKLKALEQTLFKAAPQFVDKNQITFPEVIDTLLSANFDDENDKELSKKWAKLGYEQFLEYFRLGLPNAVQYRFWRNIMLVSLYTGTLSARVCAGMLRFRTLFGRKKADFDLNREDIDEWTKSQRERFQQIAENFGNAIPSNIVQDSGRSGYVANRSGEEANLIANADESQAMNHAGK